MNWHSSSSQSYSKSFCITSSLMGQSVILAAPAPSDFILAVTTQVGLVPKGVRIASCRGRIYSGRQSRPMVKGDSICINPSDGNRNIPLSVARRGDADIVTN
jgi:hypothetical protein